MSQYFEIHPENPQARLIQQSVQIIRKSGVVVYPTDSGYAIGCQIGNKAAADRICQIREIDKEHNFTLMCRDLSELATYARVDNDAFRLLKNNSPGPYTFILKGTKEVPKRLLNPKRKTIGIRVPTNRIAMALLEELNEPLMSTSLVLGQGMLAESDPEGIRDKLETLGGLIIDGGHKGEEPTTVVDLSEGAPTIRREGSGDVEPFDF